MTSIKDWVLSQMLSKSICSLRSLRPISSCESFLSEESPHEELGNQGSAQSITNLMSQPVVSGTHEPSSSIVAASNPLSPQVPNYSVSNLSTEDKDGNPLAQVEALQIKFLRVIQRLGLSRDNITVAKVLYRIHLAGLIRAGESDLKRDILKSDRSWIIAAEQESTQSPELDFSLKILVLGKTGVGKSSTINSILGESKVMTDAFHPATANIQEIVGIVNGIKISFIDTPGLFPSSRNTFDKNRKILHSVKRFIRKSSPDVVLYFERLDLINAGHCDFPLLKLITDILGPTIWFSISIVMTHSSAVLPEGPSGHPVSYDSYVSYCTEMLQRYIHLAISDTKLENPVIMVENHPYCAMDNTGRKILPNGQVWISQFMLLCICTKILGDVNSLLEFEDGLQLGPSSNNRVPSLPHMLSSFLKHRVQLSLVGGDDATDDLSFSDVDEEDEYDQLPPIRILTKAQFQKLTPPQKKDYLDELDYRETLYLKKQLKQEYIQRMNKDDSSLASRDNPDEQEGPPEPVMLPDMAIPLTFSSESPVHRYRCLVMSDQFLARPVLDSHGWDHDVGFDGINLEIASEIRKNVIACVTGQMSKDKQEFNLQSESTIAILDPRGPTYSVGMDVQSAAKEWICSVRGNTKLKNFRHNVTECGVSVTSFGNKYFVGAKIEDSFLIKKRLKFKINAGGIRGAGRGACGGTFEAIVRGKDYPVRDDNIGLSMTILSCNKDIVLGGQVQSDFRLSRGSKLSLNANVNSRKMGQVCVKVNSSEHINIALLAFLSVFRSLFRRKTLDNLESSQAMETG